MTATVGTTGTRWAEEFRRVSNQDPQLRAHGRHFTCSYLLDMGERRYLIRMDHGNAEEILVDPGPLDRRYEFAIRASADTWRRFARETPEPMYQGIFAASFRGDMELTGDLLVLMQNLRCVVRQLELLRQSGPGV
jgi:hypothetical protein